MLGYCVEQIQRKKITWPEQERKHFGQAELAELAATLRTHGLLEPIGVIRDGEGYRGLFGQRRWIASEIAGLEFVPAVVREKPPSEAEAMEIRLIENMSRVDLRPLELSVGLDQLMKASGLSASDVAKRVGMKPAAVSKSLSLLQLPEPTQSQLADYLGVGNRRIRQIINRLVKAGHLEVTKFGRKLKYSLPLLYSLALRAG